MSPRSPAAFALQLATFATRTGGPLPLLDGLSASLGYLGVAVMARPAQRASGAVWLRQTPTWDTLAPSLKDPADPRSFVLVVQWRRLLSRGLLRHSSADHVSPALRRLSHQLWWALLPLIKNHDVVMAQLLEAAYQRFRENSERAEFEPLWVGFDTEDDERRFDAQATALLASRRSAERPHPGFCEAVVDWLEPIFAPAVHTAGQRTVGLCTIAMHHRGQLCSTCPEIATERPFITVFDVPALLDRRIRRTMESLITTEPTRPESTARHNLQWLLSVRSRRDGVCTFQHVNGASARFIDFQRVWARWKELEMPTMFDHIADMDKLEGPRQARAFFSRFMDGAVIPEHSYSAEQLFVEAGWGTAEDFATSYSQFEAVYDGALIQRLTALDQRAGAIAKARLSLPKLDAPAPKRRIVTRRWTPLFGGPAIPVRIIRATSRHKERRNFYTLPHAVEDAMLTDRWLRIGRGLMYDSEFYWTAHAINHFASKFNEDNEPIYPWAREFCEWVNLQEAGLCDDKLFQDAIYSERLPRRLEAIARGDRSHLGMFSDAEDEIIREFFFRPTTKKRLSPQDWQPLLEKLPGRNELGVLKRFEALGKKYAFQHGYQAYKASPYFRKFAAKRRAQWIKEGCPQ